MRVKGIRVMKSDCVTWTCSSQRHIGLAQERMALRSKKNASDGRLLFDRLPDRRLMRKKKERRVTDEGGVEKKSKV
jgi:hypothetical protein